MERKLEEYYNTKINNNQAAATISYSHFIGF
jgi:hypothetical protein